MKKTLILIAVFFFLAADSIALAQLRGPVQERERRIAELGQKLSESGLKDAVMDALGMSAGEDLYAPSRGFTALPVGDHTHVVRDGERVRAAGEEKTSPYVIYPGDVVEVNVYGAEGMHNPGVVVRVAEDGKIFFPLLGEVELAGLAVNDAAKLLDELLLDGYLKDPQVTVYLHERVGVTAMRTFSVAGAVAVPGIYPLRTGLRLVDAVNYARGATIDADTDNIKVIRQEEVEEVAYVMGLYEEGMTFNISAGDRIIIDSYGTFHLYGEVMRPGKHIITKDLTVTEAILQAGGFTHTAGKNAVRVIRKDEAGKRKVIKVPVAHIFRTGRKEKYDVPLKDGDIVVAPETWF